jgi:hypothetical protein
VKLLTSATAMKASIWRSVRRVKAMAADYQAGLDDRPESIGCPHRWLPRTLAPHQHETRTTGSATSRRHSMSLRLMHALFALCRHTGGWIR